MNIFFFRVLLKTSNIKYFIFSIFLFSLTYNYSQDNFKKSIIYDAYDSILGKENLKLYQGPLFIDEYAVNNEKHRFFESSDLALGNVTYDGNVFYNQKIKYDLFEDKLILNPKNSSESLLIELIKNNVDSFTYKKKVFKIFKNTEHSLTVGYLEVLSKKSNIQLLKKHFKSNQGKTNKNIYYEFKLKNKFYIFYQNSLIPFNTKQEVISIYPDRKIFIKQFFQANNTLKKNYKELFIYNLFLELTSKIN
ncbi:hypothetical protein [Cellulophaga algicola]|nr:hypothetical protein [Cellulophaga algicola]